MRSLLLVVLFVAPLSPATCLANDAGSQQAAVERIIDGVIREQRLIGTQAAVWQGGKLILDQSWGTADSAMNAPVVPTSRFFLASITKTMTGLAVLRLADQERIDLDAAIQDYVKEFPRKPGPPITPRLLLEHRGGIRHYRQAELNRASFFDKHYPTASAALEKFADDPLAAVPGEKEQYSSYGYTLLAALVESVTGERFADHLENTIFQPFGMSHTEVPDWRYPVAALTTSYGYFLRHLGQSPGPPFEGRRLNFSYNPGGGNVVSNSRDLVTFGRQFLDGGSVSERLVEEILRVHSVPAQRYGWYVVRDRSDRVVMHATGASEAYQGSISVWPAHELVVVALSNTWGIGSLRGGFTLPMHQEIADLVLAN